MCIRDSNMTNSILKIHQGYNKFISLLMGSTGIFNLIGRILAAAASIFLAVVAILRFDDHVYYSYFHIMAAIYLILAFLIVMSVVSLPSMKRYFAFSANSIGLGIFMIFCGFLVYNWNRKSEFACAICLFAGGAINCLIGLIS
eukprot:TRINITY_DN7009_c0_g1_i2.p1 TRINITY_DN7009_c0_g1~~TRINITY_DN7009_c0_g1_i2.p1  ORF type:complete len:143 (+),score=24.40 TRINITY_DN7009_c0_g1_i2:73-501(+)